MKYSSDIIQEQIEQSSMDERNGETITALNFNVNSYQFQDLDLAMAVDQLSQRDRSILVLHLMGHTQESISEIFSLSRSMISKRLTTIVALLKQHFAQDCD